MSFFKKLFAGNKKENTFTPPSKNENTNNYGLSPELFTAELNEAMKRYYSNPMMEFDLVLTDDNGKEYEPHIGFNATFSQWQNIRSKWDRMSLLYELFDQTDFNNLKKWQVIERYSKDRHAIQGILFLKDNETEEDYNNVHFLVALAKTHRLLCSYKKAREIIEHAYKHAAGEHIVKVEYATFLHICGTHEEKEKAHQIINEIIKEKIEQSDATEVALLNYFIFSDNYIDSSVFAALFLNAGNATGADWDNIANEYYYCPVFRYEHAIKLSKDGDSLKALAKLSSLSEEFPWFKEGIVTTIDAIKQFRIKMNNPKFMQDEMEKLERKHAAHSL